MVPQPAGPAAAGTATLRAAAGAQPGQPRAASIPGLQELLQSLKNPQAHQEVLNILRSNPQLMAQVIKMQSAKQQGAQQLHQQQQQHPQHQQHPQQQQLMQQQPQQQMQLAQQPQMQQQVMPGGVPQQMQQPQQQLQMPGGGMVVQGQVPTAQMTQQQWAMKQQQMMAMQRAQHGFQQPQPVQFGQRPRQPHGMGMPPQQHFPAADGSQFVGGGGAYAQQQQQLLMQQQRQSASPHQAQQLLQQVVSPPPGSLAQTVRSPQPIGSPRLAGYHTPSPHRPASHSPHPGLAAHPAAAQADPQLANELLLSQLAGGVAAPVQLQHDNADKLSKFADTL